MIENIRGGNDPRGNDPLKVKKKFKKQLFQKIFFFWGIVNLKRFLKIKLIKSYIHAKF